MNHLKKVTFICIFILFALESFCLNIGKYTIILSKNPSKAEIYSAHLLKKEIKTHYNQELKILSSTPNSKYRIEIGKTESFLKNRELQLLKKNLSKEGLIIFKNKETIYLFGGSQRGPYNAVVSFLESDLGIYKLTPKISILTKKSTAFRNRIENPAFEYRHLYYNNAYYSLFSEYNKLNPIHYNPLFNDSMGGNITMYQHCALTHTFNCIIPVSKYYSNHPEYFSSYKGQDPLNYIGQLCLSNDTVYQLVKDYVINLQSTFPANQIFNFTPNDCPGTCECSRCYKTNMYEDSRAGTLIRFINRLSKDLSNKFPNLKYTTLAYLETSQAPKFTTVDDKITVIVSTDTTSWNHSFTPIHKSKSFVSTLNSWMKITKSVWIWDYTTNFGDYFTLHPSIHAIFENLKFYYKVGIKGIILESHSETGFVEENPMRSFVYAHLLWNPNIEYKSLIKIFVDNYYGSAAPFINTYYNIIYSNPRKLEKFNYEEFISNIDSKQLLNIITLLDRISQLNLTTEYQARINEWRIPILYSLVKYRNQILTPHQYKSFVQELELSFTTFKVDRLSNGDFKPMKFIDIHKIRSNFFESNLKLRDAPAKRHSIIDASKFKVLNYGDDLIFPTIKPDNEAVNGLAIYLPNILNSRLISFDLNRNDLETHSKWSVKLRLKADKSLVDKGGVNFYIVDIISNKTEYFYHIPNKELKSNYSIIEVYKGKLQKNKRLYIAADPVKDVKYYNIDYLSIE